MLVSTQNHIHSRINVCLTHIPCIIYDISFPSGIRYGYQMVTPS